METFKSTACMANDGIFTPTRIHLFTLHTSQVNNLMAFSILVFIICWLCNQVGSYYSKYKNVKMGWKESMPWQVVNLKEQLEGHGNRLINVKCPVKMQSECSLQKNLLCAFALLRAIKLKRSSGLLWRPKQ